MLICGQLGLVSSDVFGQGILEIGQGKVKEFYFYSLWEPCYLLYILKGSVFRYY